MRAFLLSVHENHPAQVFCQVKYPISALLHSSKHQLSIQVPLQIAKVFGFFQPISSQNESHDLQILGEKHRALFFPISHLTPFYNRPYPPD
jgi:hypothetical protein